MLAAGGIGCGRQIAAALALGAVGVWMGSAWLTTQEYAQLTAAPAVRQALLAATSLGHGAVADLQRQARPAAEEPLDRRPGNSRARPSRSACRCRTCWSARRTSA